MKFKVGDRVKFLNENGGGIITKIDNKDIIFVAIEDGFEIPVVASDLVLTGGQGIAGEYFDQKFNIPQPVAQPVQPQPEPPAKKSIALKRLANRDELPKGLYLAFVPSDQQNLIAGTLDLLFVNHTDHDVLFNLFLKKETIGYKGTDYNVAGPNALIKINTISREEIENWCEGIIQVMLHTEDAEAVYAPLSSHFKLKAVRFYHENSFKENNTMPEKAMLYTISELTNIPRFSTKEADLKYDTPPAPQKAVIRTFKEAIDAYKTTKGEAEVDLHISAITDDYSELKSHDIFNMQMDIFHKALDSAMANRFHKVIFIHGIGNGTLKKTLKQELRSYPEIEVRDAPFAEYGAGAIVAKIHYE